MNKPRRIPINGDPPLGRRERKALATRRALIDAGLRAFERHPIDMVSVLDITDAADAAKGVFYLHFNSKDDYLLAICEEVYRAIIDDIHIESRSIASTQVRLEAVVDAYDRLAANNRPVLIFMCRMSSYLPDEVGPPGKLTTVRSEFLRELGGILAGRAQKQVPSAAWRRAKLIDAVCISAHWQSLRLGDTPPSRNELMHLAQAAVETKQR